MRRLILSMLIAALLVPQMLAQQFWEKKPWPDWSKGEAQRLLENSPWARVHTVTAVHIDLIQGGYTDSTVTAEAKDRQFENAVRIKYTVQFRSARPIREALVRQAQLAMKLNTKSAEQKKQFETSAEQFLATPKDKIAVYVAFESNVQGYNLELLRYWQSQNTGALASSTFLNLPGGKKLPVTEFMMSKGQAFQLSFDRPSGVLPAGDITLQFTSPALPNIHAENIIISYPIGKMLIDGNLEF